MQNNKIDVIAFYLPQYYPIKENNEWYGPGFTEWTNVGKAKPLFKGHYQPKVPADLGYYDLRLPEVREQQAELAKEAGISAFCYYHYWFGNGVQMLDMPLKEVVRLKEPDFPFCICWANHSWFKKTWDSETSTLNNLPLINQEYPGADDIDRHFYSLLDCFIDPRYYKINGRLVFVFYHIDEIPEPSSYLSRWSELAKKEGLPGFLFMAYSDDIARLSHPAYALCDKVVLSCKYNLESIGSSRSLRKFSSFSKSFISRLIHVPLNKYEYKDIVPKLSTDRFKDEGIIPVLFPNWDNTPRRNEGALILNNCTPDLFYRHCQDVFSLIKDKSDKTLFLKSWNEWGEGNYMEPCIRYNHGYIRALAKALHDFESSNVSK
ncbi:MAG: glycoside hydrolase family 99-like domain-containing protein [Bacteroidales bacterium]|nr:glycoside hydrolase family 99-like domain-containing protein [Bacteroidales bacterium]